jgi:hypothetical protein
VAFFPGTRLGLSEIVSLLWARGMGEVYRATGVHVLTMQLVEGQSLDRAKASASLPRPRVLTFTKVE